MPKKKPTHAQSSQIEKIRRGGSTREQKPPRHSQQHQLHPPVRPHSEVSEVPSSAGPKSPSIRRK